MDVSFSDEFPCISPATSGRISSSQEEIMCFYSVPTSPSFKVKASSLSGSRTEPTTPTTYEDANSNLDEFEFETSRCFNPCYLETDTRQEKEEDDEKQKQRPQRKCGDSLPTMAFADELFCNGKVLPLGPPLKLPPRLQNGSGKKRSTPSSTASLSPRSPGSLLRFPFLGQSFWNDDFDPFTVALEVVKDEEKRWKSKGRHGIRRTRSLSPFRGKGPNRPSEGHCGPCELVCEVPKEPLMPSSRSPKVLLCEPKGSVFARRVRLVGVDKNGPIGQRKQRRE